MANPKPSGFPNTREGKAVILERTKKLLDTSALIITIPIEGVTKENTDLLRKNMPKATKASVVKNAILRKAIEGTQFASLKPILKQENLYLFVPEGEAKKSYDAFKAWQKEIKRTDEKFAATGGALENVLVTGPALEAVVGLPSKKDLITKIAQGIKAVPTKVAKGIKAVPDKVGRAFAAYRDQLEEKEKAATA